MAEFDLNKMNEALYKLKDSPKAHQKSEVLSMLIDDMSAEILNEPA